MANEVKKVRGRVVTKNVTAKIGDVLRIFVWDMLDGFDKKIKVDGLVKVHLCKCNFCDKQRVEMDFDGVEKADLCIRHDNPVEATLYIYYDELSDDEIMVLGDELDFLKKKE